VRLKQLVRKTTANVFLPKESKDEVSAELELGRQLDASRRRVMHWFGKIVMFCDLGYLRKENVLIFPGRARATHAVSLLEPLMRTQEEKLGLGFANEHRKIIKGIKVLFMIGDQLPSSPSPSSSSPSSPEKDKEL
jgi:hypothetical protein